MAQAAVSAQPESARIRVDFVTHPDRYRHWSLSFAGPIATLTMNVDEEGALRPGYKLKLNSYDLGVDIELHDALQRIRFEHPEVRSVVLTSGKDRIFCSGANIFMLGLSSHAWKVNFCKFTNETRNGIEDSSRHSGLKFLLACDEIYLVDDRSAAVSLPEVPLLGVLPGTGGLTRLTDKRKVRRDQADLFCTLTEGVRAPRAKEWRLIDGYAKPQQFAATVHDRARELASASHRPTNATGVTLTPLERVIDDSGYHYSTVDVVVDAATRTATLTIHAPKTEQPKDLESIHALGARWWPLTMARELDDAILMLRSNDLEIGTWVLKTRGDAKAVLECDATLQSLQEDWFVRETLGMLRRTLARLDVTSRSLFAVLDSESCFAGTLFEIALAADRIYMLDTKRADGPQIILSELNFGPYETVARLSRLAARFYSEQDPIERCRKSLGKPLNAGEADRLGLVTARPDELDWEDELRIALEERRTLSPDALTGLEASLRFGPGETLETRVFGRLSAWQNWIFIRPNAVGEAGALKVFGSGNKARFNWERV
jgi:benzoyl-CoA-dihydrodiol lyase